MANEPPRRFGAGDSVDDFCRACKAMRGHSVLATAVEGIPIRVICGFCGSQHNYRGGAAAEERAARAEFAEREVRPRSETAEDDADTEVPGHERAGSVRTQRPARSGAVGTRTSHAGTLPTVTERERRYARMTADDHNGEKVDLEMLLRRVIREEMGVGPTVLADKWKDGEMILRPGRPGLQEKTWPIETLFQKVISIRNKLRVLEQQVNAAEVPTELKLKLQSYITGCYGSLTSFNVLFTEEEDRFRGAGGAES